LSTQALPAPPAPSLSSTDIADFTEQLTDDIHWREKEIIDLENCLLSNEPPETQQSGEESKLFDSRRKCIWVMIYAHYEGFFKNGLEMYITSINKLQLPCKVAHSMMNTWSLSDIFDDLEKGESKDVFFRNYLPSDEIVHRISRRHRLVSELRVLEERIVNIPESAVSTHSNLDYPRLQQLLFQAGFDHNIFSKYDDKSGSTPGGKIRNLVRKRHQLAHTARSDRISREEYDKTRQDVFSIMTDFAQLLVDSLESKGYLRTDPTPH
jgi:hypothetical protein